MKVHSLRIGIVALLLGLSCNSAMAVTWFDSNIRPDGVGDTSSNDSNATYSTPVSDDNNTYASPSNSGSATEISAEVVSADGDVFDSGD